MTRTRTLRAMLLGLLALSAAADPGTAQTYPSKPIRMVVPFPPGGITDTLARITGQALGEALDQTVIMDNRAGANGAIGTEVAVRAAPDGYTLLLGAASTQVLNPLIHKFPYDPIQELTPIGMVAETALMLVVNPAVPAASVTELIGWLKSHPSQANFGSYGEASASHLAGELFKQSTGVAMTHVAYKGAAPAQTDLMSGELSLMFSDMSVIPHVRGGRLRGLAVTGLRRSLVMPELPTVDESGVPGFEVGGWFALFVRAGTPQPVIDRLRLALDQVVSAETMRRRVIELGLDPSATPPDALVGRMTMERAKWAKVIADAHIQVE
ncbi:MAG: tripartite tricarboxylate transporter substrate binding protein [Pseudomonadota bacterium]